MKYSGTTLRAAAPRDIFVGNIILYAHDDAGDRFWAEVCEVLRPNDQWKAYVADDGCRYGLDGAHVLPRSVDHREQNYQLLCAERNRLLDQMRDIDRQLNEYELRDWSNTTE